MIHGRALKPALTIFEALAAAEPMNAIRKRDLASVNTDIGETLGMQGNDAGSLARYRVALGIIEALAAADTADVRPRQDLPPLYMAVGDALSQQRRFAEAGNYCARAVAIAEDLSRRDPTNVQVRADLAESYAAFGRMEERIASAATNRPAARRSWLEARSWYERSQRVWLELRDKNALMGFYEGKPQEAAKAISRCDSSLLRPESERGRAIADPAP